MSNNGVCDDPQNTTVYDQVFDVAYDFSVCIVLDDDTPPVCSAVPDGDILVFYSVHNGELAACIRHGIRAVYAIHNDALVVCGHHGIRALYAIHNGASVVYNVRAFHGVHKDEVVLCVPHDNVRQSVDIGRSESVLLPLLSAMLKRRRPIRKGSNNMLSIMNSK